MRRSLKKVMVKEISNATMECKLKHNENKWRIITVYSKDRRNARDSDRMDTKRE